MTSIRSRVGHRAAVKHLRDRARTATRCGTHDVGLVRGPRERPGVTSQRQDDERYEDGPTREFHRIELDPTALRTIESGASNYSPKPLQSFAGSIVI